MGIFSVRYRRLAKEAFDCTFKKITLRPCDTGFDQRVKAKVVGKYIDKKPKFAKFLSKYFNVITNVLVIIFVLSLVTSGFFMSLGVYNYAVYGNCNGPHSEDFCIFDPFSDTESCGSEHCAEFGCECGPKDTNCTIENNFAPCGGECDCNVDVCG